MICSFSIRNAQVSTGRVVEKCKISHLNHEEHLIQSIHVKDSHSGALTSTTLSWTRNTLHI